MSVSGISGVTYSNGEAREIAALIMQYSNRAQGGSAVYNAAKENDLLAVRRLIAYGGDWKEALYGSLQGKNMSVLQYLLTAPGGSISTCPWFHYWNGTDWWEGLDLILTFGEKIPLLDHFMGGGGNPSTLRGLVERGAKFSIGFNIERFYEGALFSKDYNRKKTIEIFEAFTKECQVPVNTPFGSDTISGYCWTPLIFAIETDDLQLANTLLKLGADPNLRRPSKKAFSVGEYNYCGDSPLKHASRKRNENMISLLLSHGAKVDGA